MSDDPYRLAEWITEQLDQRDMNQSDLARALGVTTGAVSNWLSAGASPSRKSLRAIARYFGADWRDLYRLAGRELPEVTEETEPPDAMPGDADRIYASVLEGVHALQLHPDDEAAIERMLKLARTEAARRRGESSDL